MTSPLIKNFVSTGRTSHTPLPDPNVVSNLPDLQSLPEPLPLEVTVEGRGIQTEKIQIPWFSKSVTKSSIGASFFTVPVALARHY